MMSATRRYADRDGFDMYHGSDYTDPLARYPFHIRPELTTISYELNCLAIPFEKIIELVKFLPYGSPMRVSVAFLFLTGCRPSEMARMELSGQDSFLKGNYVFWKVGKNQDHGWRKEYLPDCFLKEYWEYRKHNKVFENKIFGWSSETLGRYFNKFVRPKLSPAWRERVAVPQRGGIHEFVLQIKGLRKSFASLIFADLWTKYADANVAMLMTCKRMRHSSTGMTAQHYISSWEKLDHEKWGGYTPGEVLSLALEQKHLGDYASKMVNSENRQQRIHDFYL